MTIKNFSLIGRMMFLDNHQLYKGLAGENILRATDYKTGSFIEIEFNTQTKDFNLYTGQGSYREPASTSQFEKELIKFENNEAAYH